MDPYLAKPTRSYTRPARSSAAVRQITSTPSSKSKVIETIDHRHVAHPCTSVFSGPVADERNTLQLYTASFALANGPCCICSGVEVCLLGGQVRQRIYQGDVSLIGLLQAQALQLLPGSLTASDVF